MSTTPLIEFIKLTSDDFNKYDATVINHDNCCDIFKSCNNVIELQSNKTSTINTNLSIKIPNNYCIKIILPLKNQNYDNSVYLMRDIIQPNANIVDQFIPLNFLVHNNSSYNYNLYNGDKIATLILVKKESFDVKIQ